jgi:hypothetical protein
MISSLVRQSQKYQTLAKRLLLALSITLGIYLLLISPVFFLYSNFNTPIKKNIEKEYFIAMSDTLRGDCYRISQNFARECPFPTREVHLNSEHTIVEILINEKWYAYDPLYKKFFNDNNVIKISFDVNRGYMPSYLKDYPYAHSFSDVKYYHSYYFLFLKYICPFYDEIARIFYMIG